MVIGSIKQDLPHYRVYEIDQLIRLHIGQHACTYLRVVFVIRFRNWFPYSLSLAEVNVFKHHIHLSNTVMSRKLVIVINEQLQRECS